VVSKLNWPNQISTGSTKRNLSIDRLRGALVIAMVIGDYISGISWIPSFLKHAPDIGLTIADLVAPAFVFVIGLNYGASFHRRLAEGSASTYRYFITRYFAILGIGAIISAGSMVVGRESNWGVLQALGTAGLVCLVFIRFPTWLRILIGLLLIVGYQYLLDTYLLESVLASSHGGPFGSLAWAALLLLSTAVADFWRKGILSYSLSCIGLSAAAATAMILVPISKNRVSLSYVLLTLAISAVVFLMFEATSKVAPKRAGIFSWWGQNAFALYLLHLLLLSIFVTPSVNWWYADVPPWLLVLQLLTLLSVMTIVAWRLVPIKTSSKN
jgi:predicted acyltransferase